MPNFHGKDVPLPPVPIIGRRLWQSPRGAMTRVSMPSHHHGRCHLHPPPIHNQPPRPKVSGALLHTVPYMIESCQVARLYHIRHLPRAFRRRNDSDVERPPPKKSKADVMDENDESYEPRPGARKDVNAESFLQQVT